MNFENAAEASAAYRTAPSMTFEANLIFLYWGFWFSANHKRATASSGELPQKTGPLAV